MNYTELIKDNVILKQQDQDSLLKEAHTLKEMFRSKIVDESDKKNFTQYFASWPEYSKEIERYFEIRNMFITSNMKLVMNQVKYTKQEWKEDAIQSGVAGLGKAFDTFDYEQGNKFSTHATNWIRNGVLDVQYHWEHAVQVPLSVRESDIMKEKRKMEVEGVEVTPKSIAVRLNCSVKKVENMLLHQHSHVSLNTKVGDEDGNETELGDLIYGSTHPLSSSSQEVEINIYERTYTNTVEDVIEAALKLSNREYIIVSLRFGMIDGIERSLIEIGKILGITQERVRFILDECLVKLKDNI